MTKNPFLPTGGTSDSFPQLQRGSLTSVGFAHEFCRYNQISIKRQLSRNLNLTEFSSLGVEAKKSLSYNSPVETVLEAGLVNG